MKKKLFVLTILIASSAAHAHYVWLERDDASGPVRAYFGEWENDKIEKTGAALDRIASPHAYTSDARQALKIERRADHLEIQTNSAEDVVLIEAGLAPRDDKQVGGKTKTVYHAKNGRGSTQAKLELELVPVVAGSNQFTLILRGAPLSNTEVKVYGPPKWEKAFKTDDKGRITIITPWSGRYVTEVIHIEQKPGEAGGEKYDRLRHVSTLSFTVKDGFAWTGRN